MLCLYILLCECLCVCLYHILVCVCVCVCVCVSFCSRSCVRVLVRSGPVVRRSRNKIGSIIHEGESEREKKKGARESDRFHSRISSAVNPHGKACLVCGKTKTHTQTCNLLSMALVRINA